MSVRPAGGPGRPAASRVLASVPWVIVLLGVGLLTAMLVVALVAFRAPERRPMAEPPPTQPLSLPSLPALPGLAPATPTPTSATPSAQVTPRPPVPAGARPPRPADRADGALTAGYRVTGSYRDSFTARLVVGNGTDDAREWRVELLFGGNVKSIQVYSGGAGIAVTSTGAGRYTLRGTGPLDPGQSRTLGLRFTRHGTGDRPGSCTVNGADCVIG